MVFKTVEQEMRQAKSVMKMTMKEVTPEFLKDFQLDRNVTNHSVKPLRYFDKYFVQLHRWCEQLEKMYIKTI